MELTTTKRRHTVAPGAIKDSAFATDADDDISLERCVVAGACTVPMLELFQHVS
jgi:kinetochore protein Spc7/SPC105